MDDKQDGVPSGVPGAEGPEQPALAGAKLNALMSHVTSGVAIYEAVDDGADFVFVDFNPAAEQIEHIGKQDVVGRRVTEVFPGVREFGLVEVFGRVWRTGQPEQHPVSVYKDERIAGWRRNYICRLPNGQVMAIYDDVTEHKRSELAARMSEQCFRAIANYTYDWEVWVGPTGRVLWTNPAATRTTGYSVRDIVAMRDYPQPLVHEDDRERMAKAFRSALNGGSGNDVQFRLRHRDGRVIWAEMSWQPIHDDKGDSLGHRESIRDITARKLAEQALEKAEREKEAILDSLVELVVHQSRDLTILWANRAACESVGRTREQIIGRHCYELWGEREESCDDCPVAQAMETGRWMEAEKSTPDGRTWVIQGTPLRNETGDVVGGVEIALDITKYKRTEQALNDLRRKHARLTAPHKPGGDRPDDEV
ncbi:MAG: PAS domain-containing protein [Sedimentisphaerales bacterium]|nr:PAS domain-containing protein [Sedimentisphaerales bacterium]